MNLSSSTITVKVHNLGPRLIEDSPVTSEMTNKNYIKVRIIKQLG